ncbi:MAG TPA: hypothetical protein VIC08_16135, partial [Cellvibrionaceae bacterium]
MFNLLGRVSLLTVSLLLMSTLNAHETGQFTHHTDIGSVKHAGSLSYDQSHQVYTLAASGANMWFAEDELHFAWNQMTGDFIVRAQVRFLGEGVDPHRKVGWHVRESLEANSAHVLAAVHGDGLTALQFRERTGANTEEYKLNLQAPDVIQLERRGQTFIMSAARMGEPFQVTQVSHVNLPDQVYVGLALTAHNAEVIERVELANVRIILPAAGDFTPYQDYIGSNLEIMDMRTLQRRIVHRAPGSIQAPNWTHDGKTLIVNGDGLLFNFDIATGEVSTLNTGFANRNNNDHVLSWDGKQIGISHHAEEEQGRSTIYVLPLMGSDAPRQITHPGVGHSYLHGFSPDDKTLIFTADRKGKYDIYAVDIATGA